jgi:hypothetical protein
MIPGSGRNGAAGLEAFGRRQALFARRMMVLSLLFHRGAAFLGSIVSHLFTVAVQSPAPRIEEPDSSIAHRWLEKLDARLAAVPRCRPGKSAPLDDRADRRPDGGCPIPPGIYRALVRHPE